MIVFRIICAILLAWSINWVLSEPEAQPLLDGLPVMATISPLVALLVGGINMASRQGWGFVVAVANGVWAGLLSIIMAGVVYSLIVAFETILGPIHNFESFVRNFGAGVAPLFEYVVNVPLVTKTLIVTAILGLVTEGLHWFLVRFRKDEEQPSSSPS